MEFSSGDRQHQRRPAPPPNYFARSVQLRLLMLVCALMLILTLMVEARKPENWQWLWRGAKQTDTEVDQLGTRLPETSAVVKNDLPGTVYGIRRTPDLTLESEAAGPKRAEQLRRKGWESGGWPRKSGGGCRCKKSPC